MRVMPGRLYGRRGRTFRGISVFGAMLWMGLFGLMTVVVVDQYQGAREDANQHRAHQLLLTLRANVESVYAGNPNYPTTGIVVSLGTRGKIPDYARTGTDTAPTIQHPFGGDVTIVGGVNSEPTHYSITFAGLEQSVCRGLGDRFVGQRRARTGLVSFKGSGAAQTSPLTTATVETTCAADGDVVFVFSG